MRVSRFVFPVLALAVILACGVLLSGDGGSNSPNTAAAEQVVLPAPAAEPRTLAQPAGFLFPPDICDYVLYLHFVIVSGFPHEPYISLGEYIYLSILCFGPLSAADVDATAVQTVTIEGDSNFVTVEGTYDADTGTFTGTGTGTVAGYPNITVELTLGIEEDGEVVGTYTMGAANELPGGYPAVYDVDGEVSTTPTPHPTETPAPTATPVPTATPGTTPTPTAGSGQLLTWGNLDCDEDEITTRDNQALLRNVLTQAALSQTEPCPDIGDVNNVTIPSSGQNLAWGDMDCDGEISTRDNQALLRNVLSQAALTQTEPCPNIGAQIIVTFLS